jgi:hypothetical protein
MHAQVLKLGSSARQRGPGLSRTHILTKSAPSIEGKSRDLLRVTLEAKETYGESGD